MSRRHRRPHPGLAAARGAARDRAAAPRAVRPPRRGHCVPADSRSRAVSQQSPVLPASPSPPKPRAESHRVAARPRRGSGRPRKKEREMEDETTGEERKKPPPQIVPSRRERSSGVYKLFHNEKCLAKSVDERQPHRTGKAWLLPEINFKKKKKKKDGGDSAGPETASRHTARVALTGTARLRRGKRRSASEESEGEITVASG